MARPLILEGVFGFFSNQILQVMMDGIRAQWAAKFVHDHWGRLLVQALWFLRCNEVMQTDFQLIMPPGVVRSEQYYSTNVLF